MGTWGWGSQGGSGYPTVPTPEQGLAALGVSAATVHAFVDVLQGVVVVGVGAALPAPSPAAPSRRFAALLLLHLRFSYGMAGDTYLPPIWEEVSRMKRRMEGLATLKKTLLRGIPSCRRVFGGRVHFSASLPLLSFIKNVSLMNPSLDPDCNGGVSRLG